MREILPINILLCIHVITNLTLATQPTAEYDVLSHNFPFVSRSGWSAREPKDVLKLNTSVSYVVIHHSHIPSACYHLDECSKAMREMQNYHMDQNGWWDIGYSFAVGSDGSVYEGRGWDILGAHSKYFNSLSIGICLIGDWSESIPPPEQLKTAQDLILAGVKQGYIKTDYKLVGHAQVRKDTDCPGRKLRDEIQTWQHYSSYPASYLDLLDLDEIPNVVKDEIRNDL